MSSGLFALLIALLAKVYGSGTAVFGTLIGMWVPAKYSKNIERVLGIATFVGFGIMAVLALFYLTYPAYLDHTEATIANFGALLRTGGQLYPDLSVYSMHGQLYGPFLSEVQAAIQSLGLPVILASKLTGLLAFFLWSTLFFYYLKEPLAKGFLLFMLPLGPFLFSNRAEALILLLVGLAFAVSKWISNKRLGILCVGVLAGLAAAVKLHAVLYIVLVAIASFSLSSFGVVEILLFGTGVACGFLGPFVPSQTSLIQFLSYLKLGVKHGFTLSGILANGFYYVVLNTPSCYLAYRDFKERGKVQYDVLAMLALELLPVITGAKLGAGLHHSLACIPANAIMLERLIREIRPSTASLVPFYTGLLALLLLVVPKTYVTLYSDMTNRHSEYEGAKSEITELANQYRGLVIGVADDRTYVYSFYRPILQSMGVQQIEYLAYMDQKLSGLNDSSFTQAIRECKMSYIAMPKIGAPFVLKSYYDGQTLLSEDVRKAFKENYQLIETKKFYSIYGCSSRK